MDAEKLRTAQLEYVTLDVPLQKLCDKYGFDYDDARDYADKHRWDTERKEWKHGRKLPSAALPPVNVTIPTSDATVLAHLQDNVLFYHNLSPVLRDVLTHIGGLMKTERSPIELQRLMTAYERAATTFRIINGIMAPGWTKRIPKTPRRLPAAKSAGLIAEPSYDIIDPDNDVLPAEAPPNPFDIPDAPNQDS